MTRKDWALTELDLRNEEDRRFPVEPQYGDPGRPAFNRMKGQRAARRKAMGYSRRDANGLVTWAKQMEPA